MPPLFLFLAHTAVLPQPATTRWNDKTYLCKKVPRTCILYPSTPETIYGICDQARPRTNVSLHPTVTATARSISVIGISSTPDLLPMGSTCCIETLNPTVQSVSLIAMASAEAPLPAGLASTPPKSRFCTFGVSRVSMLSALELPNKARRSSFWRPR